MNGLISSRQNPLIIETAKLKEKKYRDQNKLFIFEGIKLFSEALAANIPLKYVFVTPSCEKLISKALNTIDPVKIIRVNDGVLDKLSVESSPQGVLCVCNYIDSLHVGKPDMQGVVFILSSLRDPGNLGTCIRSASAFSIDELILSNDCADIYNSKTVRATMGSLFRQKISISDDLCKTVSDLKDKGYIVYAAALGKNSISLNEIKTNRKTVFVVGNEGHGLDKKIIDCCHGSIIIPINEKSESLNASTAASLLMWEQSRS